MSCSPDILSAQISAAEERIILLPDGCVSPGADFDYYHVDPDHAARPRSQTGEVFRKKAKTAHPEPPVDYG